MNWRKFFQILGLIAALLSLMPLVAADYWWIRVFDFPHLLLTGFTLLAIILYFFTFKPRWANDYLYIVVLLGCFVFQMTKIYKFLPLSSVEVEQSTSSVDEENKLLIYSANILQKNKEGADLYKEINEMQPDLLLFMEVNQRWAKELRDKLGSDYAYKVEEPLDNTYGMIVYSKLPLVDPSVEYVVDPEIPSIHSKVRMKNGSLFQLYAIHPTPPMPQHNPKSTNRDKELMKTAIMAYNSDLPVILMGDFNDVSWSDGTELTKIIGKLLDYRLGRGFYNSFNAKNPIMRWPLDHILVSKEFRHEKSGTGVGFNSDHFPAYAYLTYEPHLAEEQEPDEPTKEQWQRARDQMNENDLKSFMEVPEGIKNLGD